MRRICFLIVCLLPVASFSQDINERIDSLRKVLSQQQTDTAKARLLALLGSTYRSVEIDSSNFYLESALRLFRKNEISKEEAGLLCDIGFNKVIAGDFPEALRYLNQSLQISQKSKLSDNIRRAYFYLGHLYNHLEDYKTSLEYRRKVYQLDLSNKLNTSVNRRETNIIYMASMFSKLGLIDSASFYLSKVTDSIPFRSPEYIDMISGPMSLVLLYMERYDSAIIMSKRGVSEAYRRGNIREAGLSLVQSAEAYHALGMTDSAIHYATLAWESSNQSGFVGQGYKALELLSVLWEKHDPAKSLQYYKMALEGNKKIYGKRSLQAIKEIEFQENENRQAIENARMRNRQYMLGGGLLILLLLLLLFVYAIRKQRIANTLLGKQKKDIEQALNQLKATQQQLIQAEKMASLGELTAGIAHEIQNPLNFVNNFSEVSNELMDEMKGEIKKGNYEEVTAIADDVKQNLEKINHHGKRADAIVKGMLQHSRSSTGQKEPTDINNLCDEYLRLAYHGLRAKDHSFNASFKTEFDPSLGTISIVPQDMGRVLLNLINNAFYAVSERRKGEPGSYEPVVTVSTRNLAKGIEISVKDNGGGIPDKIREKIFQPFFTTKPTGEGTGLGLSLSYDIVTKGHGGEILVQSQEGEGTEFIIKLPFDRANP